MVAGQSCPQPFKQLRGGAKVGDAEPEFSAWSQHWPCQREPGCRGGSLLLQSARYLELAKGKRQPGCRFVVFYS